MDIANRVAWILFGVIMVTLGTIILCAENPSVGMYNGPGFPTFHWVGWMSLIYGIYVIVMSIYSFRANKKKRLADLARCKARREQEAKDAKAEIAKNEDNQHP